MTHGMIQGQVATKEGVTYFRMEAAGLMTTFHLLKSGGIYDYANSHKDKILQPYAAAVAAAFARMLLDFVDKQMVLCTAST